MRPFVFVSLVVFSACANDLRVDHPFDGQTTTGPLVSAEVLATGGTKLFVDATNKMSQVYVDLDEAREMKPDEAFSTNAWDLSFKRFEIGANSGASSPTGTVELAVLKGVDYDSLTQAPGSGFSVDTPEKIFSAVDGGWYLYDLGVHQLLPRAELIYAVKSSTGAYFKLRMLSYYDSFGTPAAITLEYAPIAAP